MDLPSAIRNWVRWCTDVGDCYPASYPGEWPMGKVMLPYKVMIDEDEALEEMERTKEPDRIWAERVEVWVQQLEPWQKIAFQTHYIYWPESMKAAWHLTQDDLDIRRARRLARATGQRVDVDEYHRLVGSAVAELREALAMFTRGV